MTPYISIKVLNSENIKDITTSIKLRYIFKYFLNLDKKNKQYQIHSRTYDKIFILNTNIDSIVNNHKMICEKSEKINPARSLFIKYSVFINNDELSINDKLYYKKYAYGTYLVDICKFNGIGRIDILQVLKNDTKFKIWTNEQDIYNVLIDDIYIYL